MTTAELLASARALLASGKQPGAFEAIDAACAGDGAAFAEALLALDALAPHPFTFLMWADGGEFVSDGDRVALVYRYERKKADVLALMGRACLRASRQLVSEAAQ